MSRSAAGSKRYTYGDYAGWDDDERWELIDGQLYSMSPVPLRLHQKLSGALYLQIGAFLRGGPCEARWIYA